MAKRPYIEVSPAKNSERRLVESLSQELTQLYGIEVYIIPNEYDNVDEFFREDRNPILNKAFKIPVILQDAANGYSGGAMFSKFGFENVQEFNFYLSAKEWREIALENGLADYALIRPMEGYLVYVPQMDEDPMFGATDFFKIKFVDKYDGNGWFPLGIHHTLVCTCEKWTYSSEAFTTPVDEINSQEDAYSNNITVNPDVNHDHWASNEIVQSMSDSFLSFDEFDSSNPFGARP